MIKIIQAMTAVIFAYVIIFTPSSYPVTFGMSTAVRIGTVNGVSEVWVNQMPC